VLQRDQKLVAKAETAAPDDGGLACISSAMVTSMAATSALWPPSLACCAQKRAESFFRTGGLA